VLDWEFAHWGAPAEDIAWMCVRDWRFGQLKNPVGGFATRAAFYAEYEKASGTEVDPAEVHYWEVMGNVRWAAASIHQGERYLSGSDPDIELVAVARRAIEMEYEALRLIEKGA
jgi:aminoglycoside phosphotransferase (APT) family kinase protein